MRNISTPFSPLKCDYLGILEKEPPRGSFPIFYPLYLQSCLRCTECLLRHYLMTFLNQSQDKLLWLTLFNQRTLKMEKERGHCEKQSRAQPPSLCACGTCSPAHCFEYVQHRYLKLPLWHPTEYLFPHPQVLHPWNVKLLVIVLIKLSRE